MNRPKNSKWTFSEDLSLFLTLFPPSTASHAQPGMLWTSRTLLSCSLLAATSHISGEPGEKSPVQGLWWPRGTGAGKGRTCKKQFHMARFAKCWSFSWVFWPNWKSGSWSVALLFLRWKNLGAMSTFVFHFMLGIQSVFLDLAVFLKSRQ